MDKFSVSMHFKQRIFFLAATRLIIVNKKKYKTIVFTKLCDILVNFVILGNTLVIIYSNEDHTKVTEKLASPIRGFHAC